MRIYAVIDTNVLVSALITKNEKSPTLYVLRSALSGKIIPLYHREMIDEYIEVLSRPRFHLSTDIILKTVNSIKTNGVEVFPQQTGEILIDMDDLIFYEVAMEKQSENAYLVTGNQKHYPIKDFIVTPAEMAEIIQGN